MELPLLEYTMEMLQVPPKLKFPLPVSVGRWADAISRISFLEGKNSRGKSSRGLGNPLYEGKELTNNTILLRI